MATHKTAEFTAERIPANLLGEIIALIPANSAYSLTQDPIRADADIATNVTLIMSNVAVQNLSGILTLWADALGDDAPIIVK